MAAFRQPLLHVIRPDSLYATKTSKHKTNLPTSIHLLNADRNLSVSRHIGFIQLLANIIGVDENLIKNISPKKVVPLDNTAEENFGD